MRRREISQRSILAALSKPAPAPKRTYVGWFVPNNAALRACLQDIVKKGKRIHVEPLENGPVKFYEEDPT